ncbi:unnamed protein product, partial [Ceratitis capitata]
WSQQKIADCVKARKESVTMWKGNEVATTEALNEGSDERTKRQTATTLFGIQPPPPTTSIAARHGAGIIAEVNPIGCAMIESRSGGTAFMITVYLYAREHHKAVEKCTKQDMRAFGAERKGYMRLLYTNINTGYGI